MDFPAHEAPPPAPLVGAPAPPPAAPVGEGAPAVEDACPPAPVVVAPAPAPAAPVSRAEAAAPPAPAALPVTDGEYGPMSRELVARIRKVRGCGKGNWGEPSKKTTLTLALGHRGWGVKRGGGAVRGGKESTPRTVLPGSDPPWHTPFFWSQRTR